jgi:hypothetical protein
MYMTGLLVGSGLTGVISLRRAGGLPLREGGIHRRGQQNIPRPFGKRHKVEQGDDFARRRRGKPDYGRPGDWSDDWPYGQISGFSGFRSATLRRCAKSARGFSLQPFLH